MQCICKKFDAPINDYGQAIERCRHSQEISEALERLYLDSQKWMAVAYCRVCGQLWAEEAAPFGEKHGGGPDCYYQIETEDPEAWLAAADRRVAAMNRAR
jgi:hypothetical protein